MIKNLDDMTLAEARGIVAEQPGHDYYIEREPEEFAQEGTEEYRFDLNIKDVNGYDMSRYERILDRNDAKEVYGATYATVIARDEGLDQEGFEKFLDGLIVATEEQYSDPLYKPDNTEEFEDFDYTNMDIEDAYIDKISNGYSKDEALKLLEELYGWRETRDKLSQYYQK